MKDGHYLLFGRKEGIYRTLTPNKIIRSLRQFSFRYTKPSTTAGSQLLLAVNLSQHLIPIQHRVSIKKPFLMKGNSHGHWVVLGPFKKSGIDILTGAKVLSDVFTKVNDSISPCKAVMVEVTITSNQPKLIRYTQDLYSNEKPHSSA